jgi:hypothetical protein
MLHPVKTPIDVLRTVTRMSLDAARHPVRTVGDVVTQGRGLVASFVTGHRPQPAAPVERPVAEPAGDEALKKQGDPMAAAAESAVSEPADAAGPALDQVITEPSAVTGPGDDDEIPSPAVQPSPDDDVEVITPVGTTGAGPAVNPDTTESDLQQPGTEPLMDPSTTKRIKHETETLRRASDLHKE